MVHVLAWAACLQDAAVAAAGTSAAAEKLAWAAGQAAAACAGAGHPAAAVLGAAAAGQGLLLGPFGLCCLLSCVRGCAPARLVQGTHPKACRAC